MKPLHRTWQWAPQNLLSRLIPADDVGFTIVDQEYLLSATVAHLDYLETTLRVAVLLAALFWWAGIRHTPTPIVAFGMSIERGVAVFAAVAFYLVINMVILDRLLRIGDLLSLTRDAYLARQLTRIAVHPWLLSPFAYFGQNIVSRLHAAKGFGVLIVAWWLCNSSLYALSDNALTPVGVALQAIFLVIGLMSMGAINRTFAIVLLRTKVSYPELHAELRRTARERTALTVAGIVIGGVIAFVTQMVVITVRA